MRVRNENGGAIIEFAIILPLLLIFIFGIVEFGLILYDKAMITNASREGARAGIVFRATVDGVYNPLNGAEITNAVLGYLGYGPGQPLEERRLRSFGGETPEVIPDQCSSSGDTIKITVTYRYTFLVIPSFVESIIGPIDMTAVTIMRCE